MRGGWLGIRVYLPGDDGWIGKIQRDIWVTEFQGWGPAVTLVKDPVRMIGLPVGEVFPRPIARKGSPIAMKGDIVTQIHMRICRVQGLDMLYIVTPDSAIALRQRGQVRVRDVVVKVLENMNVVPGVRERTYSRTARKVISASSACGRACGRSIAMVQYRGNSQNQKQYKQDKPKEEGRRFPP
jgi:hypothetical protein